MLPGTLRSREVTHRAHTRRAHGLAAIPAVTDRVHSEWTAHFMASPLTNRATQNGELRRQLPLGFAKFVGTVLLLGRGRIRVVGAARLLVGRTLGADCSLVAGFWVVFVQARLNFITTRRSLTNLTLWA